MMRSLIGTRIRERRRAIKLTQTALADIAGISTSYMNLIEHNHRGIAGRTLLAIADGLGIDPKELTDGADQASISRLQQAAAVYHDHEDIELGRIEEFIGRFPGWANLVGAMFEKLQMQDERLQALSDRLGRDPFFSEAMHLMLSNVTVIHSTSDILANNNPMDTKTAQKFLSNIQIESQQLSETIVKLLDYFDETDKDSTQRNVDGKAEGVDGSGDASLSSFWEKNDYFLPALEGKANISKQDIQQLTKKTRLLHSDMVQETEQSLKHYHQISQLMALDRFLPEAKIASYDPVKLSQIFNTSVENVFYRLAHLPDKWKGQDLPQFGLIECDIAGGVLFRKPLKTLALPKKGGACSLWPLYRALSQPLQPIRAILETPTGENFISYSYARWNGASEYDLPSTTQSAMLFTADFQPFLSPQKRSQMARLKIGLNCEVCPRENCSARRAKSILQT